MGVGVKQGRAYAQLGPGEREGWLCCGGTGEVLAEELTRAKEGAPRNHGRDGGNRSGVCRREGPGGQAPWAGLDLSPSSTPQEPRGTAQLRPSQQGATFTEPPPSLQLL